MGEGLQFASVVALTVSFGSGLSATIHFLNRMRLEDEPDADPGVGVERATVLVGPALILTSVVLACGLAVTVLSDLPSLRLFGWLSAFAMIAALVADLLILRPTAMFLRQIVRRLRAKRGRRLQAGESKPAEAVLARLIILRAFSSASTGSPSKPRHNTEKSRVSRGTGSSAGSARY